MAASHQYYPLPDHPELAIIEYPGYREYRLYTQKPDAEGNYGHSSLALTVFWPSLFVALVASCWQMLPGSYAYPMVAIFLVLGLRSSCFQLLYESVILLPPHGIQLEAHRGPSSWKSLFASRRFIPADSIEGVVIHEGLKGWNVLYYLAAIKQDTRHGTVLEVAFENILPNHSILLQVFEGIHETVLSSPIQTQDIGNANV